MFYVNINFHFISSGNIPLVLCFEWLNNLTNIYNNVFGINDLCIYAAAVNPQIEWHFCFFFIYLLTEGDFFCFFSLFIDSLQ